MLCEFLNITYLYDIRLCPEEIFYSYVNPTAIDTRRLRQRWLCGVAGVLYGTVHAENIGPLPCPTGERHQSHVRQV